MKNIKTFEKFLNEEELDRKNPEDVLEDSESESELEESSR